MPLSENDQQAVIENVELSYRIRRWLNSANVQHSGEIFVDFVNLIFVAREVNVLVEKMLLLQASITDDADQ